jgi:hypothetical protein
MAIYRFKVSFEDYDDVTRIIEIKSTQTFLDFHNCIQEAIKFDNKHAASFFKSDDYWRKNNEVTLLEEDVDDESKLMATTKIAGYIEHPYQRFIYLYDKNVQWSFLIELIKIEKENPKLTYPVCIKSVGNSPKQYKQNLIQPDKTEIDPIMAALSGISQKDDIDDELEDEAYKNVTDEDELGLNEEDLNFASSEEGEEDDQENQEEDSGDEENDNFGYDDEKKDEDY